jgi:hypothetical protein
VMKDSFQDLGKLATHALSEVIRHLVCGADSQFLFAVDYRDGENGRIQTSLWHCTSVTSPLYGLDSKQNSRITV